MSWYSYFKLLKKYDGDLRQASKREIDECRTENFVNPSAALQVATEHYAEEKRKALSRVYAGIKERSY